MKQPNILIMFFGFVFATIILYTVFDGRLQTVYTSVNLQHSFASEHENLTRYIASDYFAAHAGGGVGNILFEFISMIGIAKSLGRIPYIDAINSGTINKLSALRPIFPNLAEQFHVRFSEQSRVSIGISSGKCCVFNGINELERLKTAPDIFLKDTYLQSFKYFESYADEIRSSILFINKSIASVGRNRLLDGYTWNATKHRICVHIRRGDFVKSALHMESREDFVVWAVNHIILKGWSVTKHQI
ncbi:unnamed protein product [Toxocara canis]|uniref:Rhamnogalacturonyl hydrolase YesR n=1 Tax=Toxocara canis TaxID=6265 RepID=A0A183V3K3_TOXCA|nr:unnamed protein product [Toxocara canis]